GNKNISFALDSFDLLAPLGRCAGGYKGHVIVLPVGQGGHEKPYAPNRPPVEERGVAEYNHLPRSVVCTSVAGDGRNGVRHWQTSCLDGSLRAANRTGRRRSPGDELNWMQSHPRRVREPRIHATFCTVPTWRCPPPMRNSQSRTEIRSNVSRTSPLQKRTKHP